MTFFPTGNQSFSASVAGSLSSFFSTQEVNNVLIKMIVSRVANDGILMFFFNTSKYSAFNTNHQ